MHPHSLGSYDSAPSGINLQTKSTDLYVAGVLPPNAEVSSGPNVHP